jgi:hypothetical protein
MELKNTIMLVLYLAFIHCAVFCQNYYPLSSGNKWIYYYSSNFKEMSDTVEYEITKDTMMANGLEYVVFEPFDVFFGKYVRTDSEFIYYYDKDSGDCPVFKLTSDSINQLKTHSSYPLYVDGPIIDTITIFAEPDTVYRYHYDGVTRSGDIAFSRKFGPVYCNDASEGAGDYERFNLEKALINGTEYGNQIVTIKHPVVFEGIKAENQYMVLSNQLNNIFLVKMDKYGEVVSRYKLNGRNVTYKHRK